MREAINLRYKFMPYLYDTAVEAHELGHPIIRPLFYEFPSDEDTYRIEDEYMVGKHVLFAPIVYPQENRRLVFLPGNEKWVDYWTNKVVSGTVESSNDLPIYIRSNSIVPPLSGGDFIINGSGGGGEAQGCHNKK